MIIFISYDITNNKLRTDFSKTLEQYGFRVQLSMFMFRNCEKYINKLTNIINLDFAKKIEATDSIYIIKMTDLDSQKNITRLGYAKNETKDIVWMD